jgi:hypothetical protein
MHADDMGVAADMCTVLARDMAPFNVFAQAVALAAVGTSQRGKPMDPPARMAAMDITSIPGEAMHSFRETITGTILSSTLEQCRPRGISATISSH